MNEFWNDIRRRFWPLSDKTKGVYLDANGTAVELAVWHIPERPVMVVVELPPNMEPGRIQDAVKAVEEQYGDLDNVSFAFVEKGGASISFNLGLSVQEGQMWLVMLPGGQFVLMTTEPSAEIQKRATYVLNLRAQAWVPEK